MGLRGWFAPQTIVRSSVGRAKVAHERLFPSPCQVLVRQRGHRPFPPRPFKALAACNGRGNPPGMAKASLWSILMVLTNTRIPQDASMTHSIGLAALTDIPLSAEQLAVLLPSFPIHA